MASPSIIQHQVKTLYHRIVQRILEETFHTQPDDLRGLTSSSLSHTELSCGVQLTFTRPNAIFGERKCMGVYVTCMCIV